MACVSIVFARLALAAGFLSAVADRLGWWGSAGQPQIAWGGWQHFVTYTATLNWFMPPAIAPALALLATTAEVALAVLLIVGYRLVWTATASGVLLLLFALAMTVGIGPKAPLDYSVYVAAAAAFLLPAASTRQSGSK